MRTVTIILPNGYASPEEFAEDCGFELACVNSHDALVKKLEEIHDITQDTTLHIECWQKLQNIAATAASALSSIKDERA